jgi:acyl-CoA thioesterase-1
MSCQIRCSPPCVPWDRAKRMRRALAVLALLGIAALSTARFATAQEQEKDCAAAAELIQDDPKLPLLAARLKQHKPVKIIAIGGSSTAGAAAQSPLQSYPERLEETLTQRFPDIEITVVNKGVPRQTAQEMVDRFPKDIIAEAPVLAIWETGTTDAVRGVDVDAFTATLEAGIAALRARDIEVMLVDMQYSRRTASIIGFDRYLATMHHVADVNEVYLFKRFEIMRFWSDNGTFNYEDVQKGDRARLAAEVYDCLARRIADAIEYAVQ